ncbi:MAG: hypothetical protein D6732_17415 [Methanobacteriota archaeon]|nr:MAG: hypothetical protein D6732_17415 [Euryarchaeota archaeon]
MNMFYYPLGGLCFIFGVAVAAQDVDPFASEGEMTEPVYEQSSYSSLLDFLYQRSYIANAEWINGGNYTEEQSILDGAWDWQPRADFKFKLRGIASYDDRRDGSNKSHRKDIAILDAYYEQEFSGGKHTLSLGRKNLGWSAGFQWRPADLIENGFFTKNVDTLDPNRYRGIDQARYDYIGDNTSISLVFSDKERNFFDGHQLATKFSFKGNALYSLLFARLGNYANKLGLSVDSSLPFAMTIIIEAVHVEIDKNELADPARYGYRLESLTGKNRYNDVFLGLTKFIDERRRIDLQYFYNGRGFEHNNLAATKRINKSAAATEQQIDPRLFSYNYLRKNYLYFAYTGYIELWKLQFKPSVMMNMDDKSYIGAMSFSWGLGDHSQLQFNLNIFDGTDNSEFGGISSSAGFSLSYIVHLI